MSFADALSRAARHNPAWQVCVLYREDPQGDMRMPGGLRYARTRTVRAVVDSRPREDARGVLQGHDLTTHRLTVAVDALEDREAIALVGTRWFVLREAVGGDGFGATVTVDAALCTDALVPV